MSDRGRLIASGLAWNVFFQALQAAVSFGAMLVLVRIIPPAEYGRVSAVLGVLTLLNAFGCGQFIAQALQLPDGEEPDWGAHLRAGLYIQGALSLAAHAVAGLFWLLPDYRPVAGLLHLAGFGMLIDCPASLQRTRLRRALRFRRLSGGLFVASVSNVAVTLILGRAGLGAWAIVLGGNVVSAVPLAIDLFAGDRWRPRPGWWRGPAFAGYRPALAFGAQQGISALLFAARGAVATAVLPGTLGFVAMGLLNRAQGLYTATVGRLQSILVETVYPVLPRYAADEDGFRAVGTRFVQAVVWLVAPIHLFVGLEGWALSRLLYGHKWVAMDPLLWPAALTMLGSLLTTVAILVILAKSRLRLCLVLEGIAACLTVPTVAVTFFAADVRVYAWTLAVAQLVAGAVSILGASQLLARGWAARVLLPLVTAGALAAAAGVATQRMLAAQSVPIRPVVHVAATGFLYLTVYVLALRILFAASLRRLLDELHVGASMRRWVGL